MHWAVLKLSALNPFINEKNVPGVMLCLVIHIEVLGLNELIFLAEGYSLNRHLPGKICRGAFRASAFLIKSTWEIHAVGQVGVAQFISYIVMHTAPRRPQDEEESCCASTLVENGIQQDFFECRTLGRVSESQLLPRDMKCPAGPLRLINMA